MKFVSCLSCNGKVNERKSNVWTDTENNNFQNNVKVIVETVHDVTMLCNW